MHYSRRRAEKAEARVIELEAHLNMHTMAKAKLEAIAATEAAEQHWAETRRELRRTQRQAGGTMLSCLMTLLSSSSLSCDSLHCAISHC